MAQGWEVVSGFANPNTSRQYPERSQEERKARRSYNERDTLEKTQSCIHSLWTVPDGDPLTVRWSGYMHVLFVGLGAILEV